MNRKIFSQKFFKGLAGLLTISAMPEIFSKARNTNGKINININPDAVKRDKTGGMNVRVKK
jgi:hypothetical protein